MKQNEQKSNHFSYYYNLSNEYCCTQVQSDISPAWLSAFEQLLKRLDLQSMKCIREFVHTNVLFYLDLLSEI